MHGKECNERDEHQLRAGETGKLDLVAADEFDPETEQAVGQQAGARYGMTGEPLNHEEVLEAGRAAAERMGRLLARVVRAL